MKGFRFLAPDFWSGINGKPVTLPCRHSGTAPRCCKPDDSSKMSLRDVFNRSHGKALEEDDGESEDRPGTNVVPILGVRGKVLLIRPVIRA